MGGNFHDIITFERLNRFKSLRARLKVLMSTNNFIQDRIKNISIFREILEKLKNNPKIQVGTKL